MSFSDPFQPRAARVGVRSSGMEPVLSSLFDDLEDDVPTVPGVCVMPEWAMRPGTDDEDPLLEDPSSWEEDTKRFRVVG